MGTPLHCTYGSLLRFMLGDLSLSLMCTLGALSLYALSCFRAHSHMVSEQGGRRPTPPPSTLAGSLARAPSLRWRQLHVPLLLPSRPLSSLAFLLARPPLGGVLPRAVVLCQLTQSYLAFFFSSCCPLWPPEGAIRSFFSPLWLSF